MNGFTAISRLFVALGLASTMAVLGYLLICVTICALFILQFILSKTYEHEASLWFHDHYHSLINEWDCFKQPYRLSVWAWSCHTTTVMNAFRTPVPLEYRREHIDAKDGTLLALDWYGEHNTSGPIVFILPGVSGHSQAGYITPMVMRLSEKGFRIAIHSHPGMNGSPLMGRFTRCFDTTDTATLVEHVRSRGGSSPIIALGYSLGACMLIKYLGELKQKCETGPITAAMIVSCPWDFTKVISHLQGSFLARLYDRYFCSIFKASLDSYGCESGFSEAIVKQVKQCNSLIALDELVTRKTWGFDNIEDYYESVGCVKEVSNVSVPTLILHSNDDPLVPTSVVPIEAIKENKHIIYAETQKGGHIAWVSGWIPPKELSWLDQTSIQCIEGFIDFLQPAASPKLLRNNNRQKDSEKIKN